MLWVRVFGWVDGENGMEWNKNIKSNTHIVQQRWERWTKIKSGVYSDCTTAVPAAEATETAMSNEAFYLSFDKFKCRSAIECVKSAETQPNDMKKRVPSIRAILILDNIYQYIYMWKHNFCWLNDWCYMWYTLCTRLHFLPFLYVHWHINHPHITNTHSKSNPCNFCMDLVCQKDKMYMYTYISNANFHSIAVQSRIWNFYCCCCCCYWMQTAGLVIIVVVFLMCSWAKRSKQPSSQL